MITYGELSHYIKWKNIQFLYPTITSYNHCSLPLTIKIIINFKTKNTRPHKDKDNM